MVSGVVEALKCLWTFIVAFFVGSTFEDKAAQALLPVSLRQKLPVCEETGNTFREKDASQSHTRTGSYSSDKWLAEKEQFLRHPSLCTKPKTKFLSIPGRNSNPKGKNRRLPPLIPPLSANPQSSPLIGLEKVKHPGPQPSASFAARDAFGQTFVPHLPAVIVTPCTPTTTEATNTDRKIRGRASSDSASYSSASAVRPTGVKAPPVANPFFPSSVSASGGMRLWYRPHKSHSRAGSLTNPCPGSKLRQRRSFSEDMRNQRSAKVYARGRSTSNTARDPFKVAVRSPLSDRPLTSSGSAGSFVIPESLSLILDTVPGHGPHTYTTSTPAKRSKVDKADLVAMDEAILTPSAPLPSSSSSRSVTLLPMVDPTVITPPQSTSLNLVLQPTIRNPPGDDVERIDHLPYPDVFDLDMYCSRRSLTSRWSANSTTSFLSTSYSTRSSFDARSLLLAPTPAPSPIGFRTSYVGKPQPLPSLPPSITHSESGSLTSGSTEASSVAVDPSAALVKSSTSSSINVTRLSVSVSVDHEVKRFRDHYRHPAYSRPALSVPVPLRANIKAHGTTGTPSGLTAPSSNSIPRANSTPVLTSTGGGNGTLKLRVTNPTPKGPRPVRSATTTQNLKVSPQDSASAPSLPSLPKSGARFYGPRPSLGKF